MPEARDRPCEVCLKTVWRRVTAKPSVKLEVCQDCGFWRQEDPPDEPELSGLYSSSYYNAWGLGQDPQNAEFLKRKTFGDLLAALPQAPSRELLDIGCATGFLMAEAQARGWDPYGVEYSAFAAQEAQRRFGSRVHQGTLEEQPFKEKMFGVITAIDVLEHLHDPLGFLEMAAQRLLPRGLLVLGTPDTSSLMARLAGWRWLQIKREHLSYWSAQNMRRGLERLGWDVLSVCPMPKWLNVEFLYHQGSAYPIPVVSSLLKIGRNFLPGYLCRRPFRCSMGEMRVIARLKSL